MTRLTLALAAAFLAVVPTVAAAHAQRGAQRVVVHIECFRGPWREIIWDRPEVGFTDDLVALGYSFAEAEAIGYRVCRDPEGRDDPQHMADVVRDILRTQPPR
ncbi:MAG: hypothetical protein Kow0013_06200 [Pararhodobacter sp.]